MLRLGKHKNQKAVKKERDRLMQERIDIEQDLNVNKLKMANLQHQCSHPNIRKYSACGEIGQICDDCGWQT